MFARSGDSVACKMGYVSACELRVGTGKVCPLTNWIFPWLLSNSIPSSLLILS